MKTNLVRAALACAVLAFTSMAAMASVDPIPGVDVIVKKNGLAVSQTQTNGTGQVVLKLPPGDYVLTVNGPSLVKAIARLPKSAKTGGMISTKPSELPIIIAIKGTGIGTSKTLGSESAGQGASIAFSVPPGVLIGTLAKAPVEVTVTISE
ncbi:MAG TPA: hypothetical protein VII56_14575 [Rhizomicrobium sp.]